MQLLRGAVQHEREGRGIVLEREERVRDTRDEGGGDGKRSGKAVLVYMDKRENGVTK